MQLPLLLILSASLAAADGYAPHQVSCPSNANFIREGNSISPSEKAWISKRHELTDKAILDYLSRAGVDYNHDALKKSNKSVNLALAFSGGGNRAMLNAGGAIAALDNRTAGASENGLGGILQSATYIAGLSGGSWALGSLIFQDWPSIDELVFEDPYDVWNLTQGASMINSSNTIGLYWDFITNNYNSTLTHVSFWNTPIDKGIGSDLSGKSQAGFPVSITDVWGRALGHKLFPKGTDNWMDSATWSGIRNTTSFANHEMPFPLITALAREPGSLVFDLNSPIVEFNPFEMGSFDTSINAFHDIKYLGTSVNNGSPTSETCINGFDNANFVIATSSSLFNEFLDTLVCPTCKTLNFAMKFIVKRFLESMSSKLQDIAWYKPNPFYNSQYLSSNNLSSSDTLYLMDGGLAGEIVPLSTLMVKERELDVVFSFDNNGAKWPDGTSLIDTYERQHTYEGKSTVCPYVPGQSTFEYYNLTAKPTFFGCNASNLTALTKDGVVPPIVIYIANRPYEFYSNTTTLKLTYSDNEKKGMVTNGFDLASRGNSSSNWPTCVGCALVRRAEERAGVEQSEQCKKCFQEYCWDGSLYESALYQPKPNFTLSGLTNNPMKLMGNNSYIKIVAQTSSTSSGIMSILASAWKLIKGWF